VITSGNSAKRAQWRADAPQPALVRFVLLSMLLHTTIVVLFGTSHGGGARRGEAMLDVLDVTFRREPGPPDAGLLAGPGAEAATGRALLQRADPQLAPAGPGRSEPMPAIEPPKISEPTPIEPATPASGQTQPEAAPPAAAEPLPRIDLRAPQEVDKPLIAPVAPPTIERLAPPQNPPALAPPLDIAPPAIPLAPAAPIERLPAPAIQRELAPPIELAPRIAPAPPAPAPVPIERLAVPAAPKAVAPPVEVPPSEAPTVPPPIDRLTAPRIDQEMAPSPNLVAPTPSAAPLAAPAGAAPQAERAAPAAGARPAPAPEVAVPVVPGARPAPGAAAEPPRLRLGAPGPDEDMFKPRRDIAAPPGESGAPRIDMEAARQRAREIASETTSTRGILPALPPPPERLSKESNALEKAVKPDCRTAYAGMGLLAVPVLVANTIGDGSCRW